MTTAAVATERLRLSTGVTNPVTRHPAVTAGAAASVQSVSGGRMSLAIGRGLVIRGFDEGLLGVQEGTRRQIDIPSELAYGDQGATVELGTNYQQTANTRRYLNYSLDNERAAT